MVEQHYNVYGNCDALLRHTKAQYIYGSTILDQRSWINDLGSTILDQRSWINDLELIINWQQKLAIFQ